jgi:hypothetical protein
VSVTPPKNDKARKEWLASLKDGDEVVVIGESKMLITKVRRCNYRSEFTDDQRRTFTLASGKEIGGKRWIVPLTSALLEQIMHSIQVQNARSRMSNVAFAGFAYHSAGAQKATDDQALACAAIMWPEEFGGKS